MDARSSGGAINLSDQLDSLGAKFVHLGLFDLDGTFRHKRVDRAKAEKLAAEGYPFCDILYRWDTAEVPYGGGAFIDRPARLFPETLRPWPFCEGEALCVADYAEPYGERSPRNQLNGQIEKARSMGFSVHSSFEFEIMLLDEKPESLRDKGYAGLRHFAPGNRTYSMQTLVLNQELFAGLGAVMGKLGIGVDALHTELGPGTFEVPLVHAEGMRAADDAALFKNFAKAYFLRSGADCLLHVEARRDAFGPVGAPAHFAASAGGWITGLRRFLCSRGPERDSPAFHRRPAPADAGMLGALRPHGECLQAARAGRLGADLRELGGAEPNRGSAGHQHHAGRHAAGISGPFGRHQPPFGPGFLLRSGAVGDREPDRAARAARG